MTLEATLKQFSEFMGHSLYGVVLERGKAFDRKSLPDNVRRGKAKECFQNAAHVALYSNRFRYCEGFATSPDIGFPVHHAWVVDTEDGKAIDVTWQDGGNECGFCLGQGVIEVEDGEDEDGYYGESEEVACDFCGGTGALGYEHHSLTDAEYFGVEFTPEEHRKLMIKGGVYDVLPTYASELHEEAA